jgi:hypothetical protein
MPKDVIDLEDLNASTLVTGTVPTARLGSGTASTATFLRGDSTWTIPSASIAGADTQVQYNAAGVLGVSPNLTFNYTTNTLTATTLVGNGAGLTNLNASNLASGTVAPARLGGGTASGSTFLRGDGSWQAAPLTPPAGSNTAVQINNGGVFGGNLNFIFNPGSTPPLVALNGTLESIPVSGPGFRYCDTGANTKGGITAYGTAYGTLAVPCACGRLTFDANHPAPNGSYSGASAGIVYYLPVNGNQITLWNSDFNDFENVRIPDGGWSRNISGVAAYTMFDWYILNNRDGTAQLILSAAWANNNARGAGTPLLTSPINGMLFSSGNQNCRYVGSIYTQATGQSADTPLFRLLWNAHNQVPRKLFFSYGAGGSSWQYSVPSGATVYVRPVNGEVNAKLWWVIGAIGANLGTVGVPWISVDSVQLFNNTNAPNMSVLAGVALDSQNPTGWSNEIQSQCNTGNIAMLWNRYCPTSQLTVPGLHSLTMVESTQNNSGSTNGPWFYGNVSCCMTGFLWG